MSAADTEPHDAAHPNSASVDRHFQIVLVEDNPTDVFLIQEILEASSIRHRLTTFKDGQHALNFFNSVAAGAASCPDLVILDLNLPRLSGSQLLGDIRRRGICEGLPVIVATSSAAPADRERSAAAGANAYFVKPSRLSEYHRLGEIVRGLLHDRAQ